MGMVRKTCLMLHAVKTIHPNLNSVTGCEKASVPLYGRLSFYLQPRIKRAVVPLGVSRPCVVGLDLFTGYWQMVSVSGGLFLWQSHVSIARTDALAQIPRYMQCLFVPTHHSACV